MVRLAVGLFLFPCLVWGAIIGADNRREWYEETHPTLRSLGQSTAALLDRRTQWLQMEKGIAFFTKLTPTVGEWGKYCPSEKYAEQLSAAECTGFLVGSDLIATADHCLPMGCENLDVIFDYLNEGPGALASPSPPYRCLRVLERSKEEDWAIIQLDRVPPNRKIFSARAKGQPELGTKVVVMGYPHGMPLKIADDATVQANSFAEAEIFLEASLDVFSGNSGSPVLNAKTFEVEGILTVAFGEFEENAEKNCNTLRTYPEPKEATLPWAVRTSRFRSALPYWPKPDQNLMLTRGNVP